MKLSLMQQTQPSDQSSAVAVLLLSNLDVQFFRIILFFLVNGL